MTRFLIATVLVWTLVASPGGLRAQQQLTWLQIEAQPTLTEARAALRRYAARLPDVNGFLLSSGWYAIALGPYARGDAQRLLGQYKAQAQIPRDSYLAGSVNYQQQFWPVGVNVLQREPISLPDTEDAPPKPVLQTDTTPVEKAEETLAQARTNERRLNRAERAEVQIMLNWAGFYNGAIDASFGRGTRNSMADWQAANNAPPTGVLTTLQRAKLARQYNAVLKGLAFETLQDETAGIEIKLPTGVVEFSRYETPFVHFTPKADLDAQVLLISQPGDRATLVGLFEIMQTLEIVPETGPRSLEENNFTLIGEGALSISHTQAWLQDGQIKGFTLVWPAGDEERRTRVLAEMQASFSPIAGVLNADASATNEQRIDLVAGLEIRKPLLTRSGFYVDTAGAVVTTADVAQNCRRITIDQDFEADLAFSDAELGIAVLRPQNALAPVGIARFQGEVPRLQSAVAVAGYSYGGILGAPTLTFGLLADLRGLNGEDGVTRLALNALSGDAGGPVIDAGGAVLGMLLPRPTNGRQLPEDVSFAASANAVQDVLKNAGITILATSSLESVAPETLTNAATDITVLVNCWE